MDSTLVFVPDMVYQSMGAVAFILFEAKHWEWYQVMIWVAVTILALEILSRLIMTINPFFSPLPAKGKPLDVLSNVDILYIWFNKLCTPLFTFHVIQFAWYSPTIQWSLSSLSLYNVLVPLLGMFVLYDFGYTLYHKLLHARGLYKYIHKHHHRQNVPSRGNLDAVNVHPIEFIMGEYNHLLVMYIMSLLVDMHVASTLAFLLLGASLASLNHTRFDIKIWKIYQVKYHDIHHWYPKANFGQYTMLWDHAFGWFHDFD